MGLVKGRGKYRQFAPAHRPLGDAPILTASEARAGAQMLRGHSLVTVILAVALFTAASLQRTRSMVSLWRRVPFEQ